jgi:hypothetical protein
LELVGLVMVRELGRRKYQAGREARGRDEEEG